MKIGVISDSHDNLPNIRKAVEVFSKNGVETLIHGGDFCSPFTLAEFKPLADRGVKMHAVFGNNDGDRVLLARRGEGFCSFTDGSLIVTLGGRKIVVLHYPDLGEDLFRLGAYDLVIYGHNHKVRVEGGEKKLLNPGTSSGYLADKATVALVETNGMTVEIVTL
ncbi:MAG TPA: metallophosphoesterase [Spirochaetia bacterium]|nr:metallophosphoesterase [Spirochaetia bacterium]